MRKLLKPGTIKQLKTKYPTELILFSFFLLVFLFPAFACTRSVSTSGELTQIAQRVAERQKPSQTSTPQAAAPTVEAIVEQKPSATPSAQAYVPQVRNTFPVDLIDPEAPLVLPTQEITLLATERIMDLPELTPDLSEKTLYLAQSGDTLDAIAFRYGTDLEHLSLSTGTAGKGFLRTGSSILITSPRRNFSSGTRILPDEYVVLAYPSIDYNLIEEVNKAGGYLSEYKEYSGTNGWLTGTEVVYKVSRDYSISPLLLLELLEYKSHWVYGQPGSVAEGQYPLGWLGENSQGLYKQLSWAAGQLSEGYYGWRYGTVSAIPFYKNPKPEQTIFFNPLLNAGSVAIQYLFSQIYTYEEYEDAIYGENGFLQQFYLDFGNVWDTYTVNPNGLNDSLVQPELHLPYYDYDAWNLTGGPHEAWSTGSPLSALDFAPQMAEHGCAPSDSWITAAAPGKVVRASTGVVVLDLDMDGNEETGWVLLYLHVANQDRVAEGTVLPLKGRIGHPSCEGGIATGTHVHIARKYNGEWIAASGPLPFVMSGWTPFDGDEGYLGGLTRGEETIYASRYAQKDSLVPN